MARVKLTSGHMQEYDRVEFDATGNQIKCYNDHQLVKSMPQFHVAKLFYEDGIVYVEDDPESDW